MNQPNSQFATTRWTVVWKAAQEDSSHGRPALEEIVREYWQPLYAFARRKGMSSEDAEDATQEFLANLVSGGLLESADPAKGRFRAFLLTAWKRFLVDQYRQNHAQRRGGDVVTVSLDVSAGEQRFREVTDQGTDPDRLFSLLWANRLLDQARDRLRDEYQDRGKESIAEVLLPKLTHALDGADYQQLSDQLQMTPGAIKVAMHRIRQRFGATLRTVVAETVEYEQEVDAELNELLTVLTDG